MSRKAEIRLNIDLDAENVPTRIEWDATEAPDAGPKVSQSFLLSLWDSDRREAAAIDLWTRDMTIEDMNLFYFQMFHRMADSYMRATKNADVANLIHAFSDDFGHALGLLARDDLHNDEPRQVMAEQDGTGS